MKSKYIKLSEVLEVNKDSITVKVEFDIKELVVDFIGYTNHIADIIKDLAERMGKRIMEGENLT